jgi:LacI family transcriptional regulator
MNLDDIAAKAGVSRATVSRVINNEPHVRPKTYEKVMAVIEQENFHPDPNARALVRGLREIVGVLIPNSDNIFYADNNYFTQILGGINSVLRERDYAMLLWLGESNAADAKQSRKIANSRIMDGLIIASMLHDHEMIERLLAMRNPIVMIDRPLECADDFNYVTIDNIHAAEVATHHLISLGRRRIGHITGHMNIADARDRLHGYKRALKKANLPIQPKLIVEGQFLWQAGYEAARELLQHKPDAIFAAGDTIALGAMDAINEAGLRIPDDIALVGFDDVDVASRAHPMLTTIRQPVHGKGTAAATLLLDIIQKDAPSPQHIVLPTELIIRQSCGALQQRDMEAVVGIGAGGD